MNVERTKRSILRMQAAAKVRMAKAEARIRKTDVRIDLSEKRLEATRQRIERMIVSIEKYRAESGSEPADSKKEFDAWRKESIESNRRFDRRMDELFAAEKKDRPKADLPSGVGARPRSHRRRGSVYGR